jgi:hypothetical protein
VQSDLARRWLDSPRAPAAIVALALLLASPALVAGFATDDHLHRILSRPEPGIEGLDSRPLDLFVFTRGEAQNRALMDAGVFPWWTDPGARLAFMRPFASLSLAIDHWLWPDAAWLAQAHNLAWFALSLLALWSVYARLIEPPWAAALALLFYAVDDARGPTVGWIANRNASIAFALAMPVLLLHLRARRDGSRAGTVLAPAWFALSLCAGESALAVVAYLVAFALFLDRGSPAARLRSLLSYVGVIVAWRLVYVASGYGVAGSGVYVDPASDPPGFALAVLERLPILLGSQLGGAWSDLAGLLPFMGSHAAELGVLLGYAGLDGCAWLMWPLLRADATSRFFAAGMVLAVLPVCSTFPADRLLTFAGLGGMGLLARFVQHARGELGQPRRAARVVLPGLIITHLVVSPPLLAMRAHGMRTVEALARRADEGLPQDESVRDKTLVIANTPGDGFVGYLLLARESLGIPRPEALRWLATGLTPVALERLDAHTLLVRPDGGFLQYDMDRMLRSPRHGFAAGQRVALRGMSVEVVEVDAHGRPLAVRATFDRPLEDPSLVWRRWAGRGLVPYRPPAVGAREVLPAIDFFELLSSTGGEP